MTNSENVTQIKTIVYNDAYYSDVSNLLVSNMLNTQSFNNTILVLATDYLASIESNPTKFSETGGITIELGNQGTRLKAIIANAQNNIYTPNTPIKRDVQLSPSFSGKRLKSQEKDYDIY